MKKLIIYLIFLLIISFSLCSQIPTLAWAKGYGGTFADYGNSVVVDPAGNVYSCGRFFFTVDFDPGPGVSNLTSAGGLDTYINKFDASGNFLWAKRIGGSGGDEAKAMALDPQGNIYLAGYFSTTVDFDPGPLAYSATVAGASDIFVCKLDGTGNFLWVKTMGGSGNDDAQTIKTDAMGNIYLGGRFSLSADLDPGAGVTNLISAGTFDIFNCKLDAAGNFVWAKGMGGALEDMCHGIEVDRSGNVYSTGCFSVSADFDPGAGVYNLTGGTNEIYVSKLNSAGNFVWAKSMGGSENDDSYSIALDSACNIYTTGIFSVTADFDPGAGVYNFTSLGSYDTFLSKLDSAGNFIWAKQIAGTALENGLCIYIDKTDVYTTGNFNYTVDFDPGPGVYTITPTSVDGYCVKLDTAGNFIWAINYADFISCLTMDAAGNIYTTGSFSGVSDFDPGVGTYTLSPVAAADAFVNKLGQFTLKIDENPSSEIFNLYPNPSNGLFNVELNSDSYIIVTNALGEIVLHENFSRGQNKIDLRNEAEGIYFVRSVNQKGQRINKIVINK